MNTTEYKILEAKSPKELQTLVNQAIMEIGKEVTMVGGMVAEIYPNFPPAYYQAILIKEAISEQVLLEKFGIGKDEYKKELGLVVEENKKTKKKKEKEVPKVIHESNQRTPNSWEL